jgi:hypothetical protein
MVGSLQWKEVDPGSQSSIGSFFPITGDEGSWVQGAYDWTPTPLVHKQPKPAYISGSDSGSDSGERLLRQVQNVMFGGGGDGSDETDETDNESETDSDNGFFCHDCMTYHRTQ